jgi:hypothetical protein
MNSSISFSAVRRGARLLLRIISLFRNVQLVDDDRRLHDRVKCTRVGKISCFREGMSPDGIRSD